MKLGEVLKKYKHLRPFLQNDLYVEAKDPYEEARDIVARLCKKTREKGVRVYEEMDEDKIKVYWQRGRSRIKVYEARYRLKDSLMLELEVRHILALVMEADRLLNEGVDKELVFNLLRRARKTNGRVSFVVKEDRIEVYDGVVLKKTFYRKLQA
ncbi:MAG: hypothetical protein QXI85_07475 [Desulfurococcaceae archaeon]